MTEKDMSETRFTGLAVSEGVAVAPVCLFCDERHNALPIYKVEAAYVDEEIARLNWAIETAGKKLETVREDVAERIGPEEAEIFVAQGMILEDRTVREKMTDRISKDRSNAEAAVAYVLDAYEARLRSLDDEYMRERGSDIGEVKWRLLDILRDTSPGLQCADSENCQKGRRRIIIAEELTPGLTLELDSEQTIGFVTERGGTTSHAAILARALGIPAVSGIKGIHGLVSCGTELLVDGNNGEVIVRPSEQTRSEIQSSGKTAIRTPEVVPPCPDLKTLANINLSSDVEEALAVEAEGIGLYRTEFEFMAAGRVLEEEEQFERYADVVRAMQGRPVCFRLLDMGGDKPLPSHSTEEDNPAMGLRGGRLLLSRPDLLNAQARALARASVYGPINVLYPMIVERDQFLELKERFTQATAGIEAGSISHGVMFEVPSACLQAVEIFEVADFGSVGTNDLIQYLFAVDRDNDLVAYDFDPDRPVFWSLLRTLAKAAAEAGRPLSLCGELAGDPKHTGKVIETGIQSVSVSPRLIPDIRRAARKT